MTTSHRPPSSAGSAVRSRALLDFVRTEVGAASVLLAAAVVALVWANSPLADVYDRLWTTDLTIGSGSWAITEDLRHWVNDGLMAVFFFVVGLEIKREVTTGELRTPRAVVLPIVAAIAGLAVPALVYLAVTAGTPGAIGWGVPVATDIAFALGVLALCSKRLPAGLTVLLLSIAIADDIGAILIIAVVYSGGVTVGWLAVAAAGLVAVVVMGRLRVASPWWYVPVAIVVWVATLESGVHATISGVALGLLTPAVAVRGRPVLEQLEHALHPWSAYVILPVFALANTGVPLGGEVLAAALTSRIAIGIVLALVVGKIVGIGGAMTLLQRSGRVAFPSGVDLRQARALAPVAGIGFTVSLFIADLAFEGSDLAEAKIGVLVASLLAGALGVIALRRLDPGDPEVGAAT